MPDEIADIITCHKSVYRSHYSLTREQELIMFGITCCRPAQSEYLIDVFDQCGNPDGARDSCRNLAMAERRRRNYPGCPWISHLNQIPSRLEYFSRVPPYPVVFTPPHKPISSSLLNKNGFQSKWFFPDKMKHHEQNVGDTPYYVKLLFYSTFFTFDFSVLFLKLTSMNDDHFGE